MISRNAVLNEQSGNGINSSRVCDDCDARVLIVDDNIFNIIPLKIML